METLKHIIAKYNIDLSKQSPFHIQCGRFMEIPKLFRGLGFKVGAEIGVLEGKYSTYLLKGVPGLKLYGVDAWEVYPGYVDYSPERMSQAQQNALERVKGFDCELIKGWSTEVAPRFEDNSIDFVFIDGNHSYEHAVADIAAWSRKVRPGGIVYGHDFDDYSNHRRWHEMNVINAVEGWMKSYRIHPWFVLEGNRNKSWMYVK